MARREKCFAFHLLGLAARSRPQVMRIQTFCCVSSRPTCQPVHVTARQNIHAKSLLSRGRSVPKLTELTEVDLVCLDKT